MDDGEKILEIRQRGYEIIPEAILHVMIIANSFIIIGVIYSMLKGKFYLISLLGVVVSNVILFAGIRTIEIHKKGIKYGVIFIYWDDISKIWWENGILKIKTGKIVANVIRIKDRNGKIVSLIESLKRPPSAC